MNPTSISKIMNTQNTPDPQLEGPSFTLKSVRCRVYNNFIRNSGSNCDPEWFEICWICLLNILFYPLIPLIGADNDMKSRSFLQWD